MPEPTQKKNAMITIRKMPRPPSPPPGITERSLSWPRRRNSSRSGGVGPDDCGPEPHGPLGPEPQGPPWLFHGMNAFSWEAGPLPLPLDPARVIGEPPLPFNARSSAAVNLERRWARARRSGPRSSSHRPDRPEIHGAPFRATAPDRAAETPSRPAGGHAHG